MDVLQDDNVELHFHKARQAVQEALAKFDMMKTAIIISLSVLYSLVSFVYTLELTSTPCHYLLK